MSFVRHHYQEERIINNTEFCRIPSNSIVTSHLVSELINIDLANAGGPIRSKCTVLSASIAISNDSETFSTQLLKAVVLSFTYSSLK